MTGDRAQAADFEEAAAALRRCPTTSLNLSASGSLASKLAKTMEREWQSVSETFSFADTELKEKEDQDAQTEKLKHLNVALRKLKPLDQNLITLRFFEDLSPQNLQPLMQDEASGPYLHDMDTNHLRTVCQRSEFA